MIIDIKLTFQSIPFGLYVNKCGQAENNFPNSKCWINWITGTISILILHTQQTTCHIYPFDGTAQRWDPISISIFKNRHSFRVVSMEWNQISKVKGNVQPPNGIETMDSGTTYRCGHYNNNNCCYDSEFDSNARGKEQHPHTLRRDGIFSHRNSDNNIHVGTRWNDDEHNCYVRLHLQYVNRNVYGVHVATNNNNEKPDIECEGERK